MSLCHKTSQNAQTWLIVTPDFVRAIGTLVFGLYFLSIALGDPIEMKVVSHIIYLCIWQELFGGYDGVKLVVDYLRRDIGKFGSGLGHHRLLLAATDCVWCTVVGNAIVEDIFLEMEGVFVLLDILEVSYVL